MARARARLDDRRDEIHGAVRVMVKIRSRVGVNIKVNDMVTVKRAHLNDRRDELHGAVELLGSVGGALADLPHQHGDDLRVWGGVNGQVHTGKCACGGICKSPVCRFEQSTRSLPYPSYNSGPAGVPCASA